MKLHQKGYLLDQLSKAASLWDEEIVARVLREYGLAGVYWEKSVRLALEELAAGGLILRAQSRLHQVRGVQFVSFQYALTDFGRQRMLDTGLLSEAES